MIDIPPIGIVDLIFGTIFLVVIPLVILIACVRADKKDAVAEARSVMADDMLLLDPTTINLGLVHRYNYKTDEYDLPTFSIKEMRRLANLQRNENQHHEDTQALKDMRKRLELAREKEK